MFMSCIIALPTWLISYPFSRSCPRINEKVDLREGLMELGFDILYDLVNYFGLSICSIGG
jgi:hypothetical protein